MRAQIVSFHCVLRSRVGGEVLSTSFNRDVITQIEALRDSSEDSLKALAEGLQDLKPGEKRRISLSADQAYGRYDLRLVRECPRQRISNGERLRVGDEVVEAAGADGKRRVARVVQATSTEVTLDANHPLAGMDLVFEIEATAAREATLDEIAEAGPERAGQPYLH